MIRRFRPATLGVGLALVVAAGLVVQGCGGSEGQSDFVVVPPSISTVSPSAGTQQGGTTVVITGEGLLADQDYYTAIGQLAAAQGNATGTTPAKTAAPDSGTAGGAPTGANTSFRPWPYPSPIPSGITIYFGGLAATVLTVSPDGHSVTVLTPPGFNKGVVDVLVQTSSSSASLPRAFTFSDPAPTVAAVTPSSAASGASTSVTIAGTGFLSQGGPYWPPYWGTPAPLGLAGGGSPTSTQIAQPAPGGGGPSSFPWYGGGPTVTVGGKLATDVILISPTQLSCTFPDDVNGAKDVVVTNADGQAAKLTNGFTRAGTTATQALAFVTVPTTTQVDVAFNPAVQVAVVDESGKTITTSNATVTIAIGTNPGAAQIKGPTSSTAVNGIASFPGLSLDRVGNGYTLVASLSGANPVTSGGFNIIP